MFNSRGAYQQPSWQHNSYQASQRTGPPPAKKPKNNPIITRYPPPPGYRGPAQPHAALYQQPPAWQQPGQPQGYSHQPFPSYPQEGYAAVQTQSQPQYPAYPPQPHYAQATYPTPAYYQQPSIPLQMHSTQQPIPWPQSAQSALPPSWNSSHHTQQQRRHFSAPSLTGLPEFVPAFASNGDVDAAQGPAHDDDDDFEEDFYAESYFATHADEVDPNFSLGMIMWKPPLPTQRPLPATFAEAELEALAPRKPLPTDSESISDYYIKSKRHEALLSVRLTEFWPEVKDDIIFKEFPVVCSKLLSIQELIAKYKDRPDPTWSARVYSPTPDPEPADGSDSQSGAMDIDESVFKSDRSHIKFEGADEHADILGSLEQAIRQNGANHSRHHSRASSVSSTSSQKFTRPVPLVPVRDKAQEDILATLGVTGSPKMVYQTPGPAIGAPPPQRDGASSRSSRHNSVTSVNGRYHAVPPPPSLSPSGRHQYGVNGFDRDRRGSDASYHTAMGSDFEDNDATPRPKAHSSDKRKRAHEDSEDDGSSHRPRYDNDETPKQRRKQSRVTDPYKARRW